MAGRIFLLSLALLICSGRLSAQASKGGSDRHAVTDHEHTYDAWTARRMFRFTVTRRIPMKNDTAWDALPECKLLGASDQDCTIFHYTVQNVTKEPVWISLRTCPAMVYSEFWVANAWLRDDDLWNLEQTQIRNSAAVFALRDGASAGSDADSAQSAILMKFESCARTLGYIERLDPGENVQGDLVPAGDLPRTPAEQAEALKRHVRFVARFGVCIHKPVGLTGEEKDMRATCKVRHIRLLSKPMSFAKP